LQMMGMFLAEAAQDSLQFHERLKENPMSFEDVERDVQALFNRGAGLFLSGLIAKAMKEPSFQEQAQQARADYDVDLKTGSDRQIQVRLGNGFTCHATTHYCPPKRKGTDDRTVPGLDIELSQFGFSGGDSPGLVSKIARSTALNPSLDLACKELRRDGIELDKSIVDRISHRVAQELLTVRERDLVAFRSGTLSSLNELAGQHISVQIDGGRTRTRASNVALDPIKNLGKTQSEATGRESLGRSKERRRRATFCAAWREPKVVIIYVHDNEGRLNKQYRATIDGTFGDVEPMTEMIAMHLHRLGAGTAASICFNGDGATWIWGRINSILSMAKIPRSVTIYRVLDVYHACENLHKAIEELMPVSLERREMYRALRKSLRDGQWQSVVEALELKSSEKSIEHGDRKPAIDERKETRRVIEYLRQHGEQGRLDYPRFKLMGLPLGSGSIESTIRRVVNLRMKGNGIFWRVERAEEMLMLRSTILSDRWDDNRLRAKQVLKRNGKLAIPKNLTAKTDAKQQASKIQ